MQAETISTRCAMNFHHPDGSRAAMEATFEFSSADPFAVSATFHSGDMDIDWVFARDLLVEGMQKTSGIGDVVISPIEFGSDPRLQLVLRSPQGEAVLSAKREDVELFLMQTYQVVPLEEESRFLNVAGALAAILG